MYYELISKPIDLTLIEQKLDHGEYFSYSSFEEDLLLLFHNAIVSRIDLLFFWRFAFRRRIVVEIPMLDEQ